MRRDRVVVPRNGLCLVKPLPARKVRVKDMVWVKVRGKLMVQVRVSTTSNPNPNPKLRVHPGVSVWSLKL